MKRKLSWEGVPAIAGHAGIRQASRSRTSSTTSASSFDAGMDEPLVPRDKTSTASLPLSPCRPTPSYPTLICLNALICGIEFSASAGFAYIPPLLLKIGLSESVMTCLMGVGPFLALGAVPIIGRCSDRHRSRFGRRRPFILGISLLLLVSLVVVPFGSALGKAMGSARLGVVLTTLGVVLLDFSCLAGFNPCEALISDTVRGTDNAKRGFMVYSCMLSFGGCIGYLISAVDWSQTFLDRILKNQEQMAFSVIFVLVVISLTTTLISAQERPLTHPTPLLQPWANGKVLTRSMSDINADGNIRRSSVEDVSVGMHPSESDNRTILMAVASIIKWSRRPLYYLCQPFGWCGMLLVQAMRHLVCTPHHLVRRVMAVPVVLRRLFVVDLCSWAALLCHNMFYTDFVAQTAFAGNPNAADGTLARRVYDGGVRAASWGLLLHSITACVYAGFVQDLVIRRLGMGRAYFLGLLVFALCMAAILASNSVYVINGCTALAGLGFAAVTTIPNTLVTSYHANKELYFFDAPRSSEEDQSEERGIGADLAILESAYFLGQITVSMVVGPLVDAVRSVSVFMAVAAMFAFLACYFATRVVVSPACVRRLQESKL